MNKICLLSVIYLLGLLLPYSLSHAENGNAPRIVDRGMDGGTRIFQVFCADSQRTSVQSHHINDGNYAAGDICYYNKDWILDCTAPSVQQAARLSCQALK